MEKTAFFFEIKDLLMQFIAAFDDVVIKRYNKEREPQSHINVRYVLAPKNRVLYDIVNKAKNITLPAVAVNLTGIRRSKSRVFNKIDGFYYSGREGTDSTSKHLWAPVPVDITVQVSIIAKYQNDIEQILSNFIPYTNPYIVISWKVPSDLNLSIPQELRSAVIWDENINLSYPVELNATDKYRITADTTFTIEGWLFKDIEASVGNIFYIDANFNAETLVTDYESLTGSTFGTVLSSEYLYETERVSVSAMP